MEDIYETWVRDMRIDGFRIDTMKHVNDEFWQKFSPHVLDYAKAQGIPNFFMFGEVADSTRPLTSHYTTHNDVQAVLDFPFQDAARTFAGKSLATNGLRDFFRDDDYYTDADSNVYQLRPSSGTTTTATSGCSYATTTRPGHRSPSCSRATSWRTSSCTSRAATRSSISATSRASRAPATTRPRARTCSRARTSSTTTWATTPARTTTSAPTRPDGRQLRLGHPLYKEIAGLAKLTKEHPALRDGAQQHRFAAPSRASTRSRGSAGRSSASTSSRSTTRRCRRPPRSRPTWRRAASTASTGPERARSRATPTATSRSACRRCRPWSTRPRRACRRAARRPRSPSSTRHMTRRAASHGGPRRPRRGFVLRGHVLRARRRRRLGDIGTDDNAPYRVFHDISDVEPGTAVRYKAVVLDNNGHPRESAERRARVAKPAVEPSGHPRPAGRRRSRRPRSPSAAATRHQSSARSATAPGPTWGPTTRRPPTPSTTPRRRAERDGDQLPRDPRLRVGDGDEPGAQAVHDGDRALPAERRRLRRLGPASVGGRDRPWVETGWDAPRRPTTRTPTARCGRSPSRTSPSR